MAYKVKEKISFFYLQNVFMQRIFSVFFTNKETVMQEVYSFIAKDSF